MDVAPNPETTPESGAGSRLGTGAGAGTAAGSTSPRSGSGPAPAALVFDDPLDRPSTDDTDRGWGDLPSGSADDDFTRFLSEKPPHHL